MKTLEQAMGYEFEALDGRDKVRIATFVPEDKLEAFGFTMGKNPNPASEWTRENILEHLKHDVAFAFEKALGRRGLSSSSMHAVVRMWNWILEEGLEDFDEYPMYGLPLYKATALKYGWPNPIGDDTGREDKYNE